MMTSAEVGHRIATMLEYMSQYKLIGDAINEQRQAIVLGLKLQAGERRRYLVGSLLMEIACDDKGEYTFRPATVEG